MQRLTNRAKAKRTYLALDLRAILTARTRLLKTTSPLSMGKTREMTFTPFLEIPRNEKRLLKSQKVRPRHPILGLKSQSLGVATNPFIMLLMKEC